MAFRFQRRIKITPGGTLNLSKSGGYGRMGRKDEGSLQDLEGTIYWLEVIIEGCIWLRFVV